MGYSKDPSLYPEEFAEIFRRALTERFEIDFTTRREAINMRHQFHAYRRAVELAKLQGWSTLRKIKLELVGSRIIFDSNLETLTKLQEAARVTQPTEAELNQYLNQMENPNESDSQS